MLLTRENVCFDWAFCNLSDDRKDFFFIDELWFPYISNLISALLLTSLGFPGGSVVKNPPSSAGDQASILGSGRPPAEGNGYPPQCSCLGNPMDRGAWWATFHGVAKSQTQLSD